MLIKKSTQPVEVEKRRGGVKKASPSTLAKEKKKVKRENKEVRKQHLSPYSSPSYNLSSPNPSPIPRGHINPDSVMEIVFLPKDTIHKLHFEKEGRYALEVVEKGNYNLYIYEPPIDLEDLPEIIGEDRYNRFNFSTLVQFRDKVVGLWKEEKEREIGKRKEKREEKEDEEFREYLQEKNKREEEEEEDREKKERERHSRTGDDKVDGDTLVAERVEEKAEEEVKVTSLPKRRFIWKPKEKEEGIEEKIEGIEGIEEVKEEVKEVKGDKLSDLISLWNKKRNK